jgi:hypothetical protein
MEDPYMTLEQAMMSLKFAVEIRLQSKQLVRLFKFDRSLMRFELVAYC